MPSILNKALALCLAALLTTGAGAQHSSLVEQTPSGLVYKYSFAREIQNIGFEALRLESSFISNTDENHGWIAINLSGVRNGWVRQITGRHFGFGVVSVTGESSRVTVEDSAMLDHKSVVTGGRRYSFNLNSAHSVLFQRCFTRAGRHDYVSGSRTHGPNVFVDSRSVNATADVGPHHRYATGQLYDNILTNDEMNVQNREDSGSGHGWAGAQIMFWNSQATTMRVQAPTGAMNWTVGAIATKAQGKWTTAEPHGIWDSHQTRVIPRSLYHAQLEERLGYEALRKTTLPQQQNGTVWSQLEAWAGNGLFLDPVVCWTHREQSTTVNSPLDVHSTIRDLKMLGGPFTTSWSKVSGPGTVTFGNPAAASTTAAFSSFGNHVIRFTATGGGRQITGDLAISVLDPDDTDPPAPPLLQSAIAGNASIQLQWATNTEPDIAGYRLYRSTTSGSFGSPIAMLTSATSFTDNSLINGTTYHYIVRAYDSNNNESANSNQLSATPVAPPNTPVVSFNFPLDGQTFEIGSNVAVQTAATAPDGIQHVRLFANGVLVGQENSAPYDWSLANIIGGTYVLEAIATAAGGQTASATITIEAVPDSTPPAVPAALNASAGNGVVSLDWSDVTNSDFASYRVYRSTTPGLYSTAYAILLSQSRFLDVTPTNGTTYYYTVSAVDFNGNESARSAEISATPRDLIDFGTAPGKILAPDAGFITSVPADGSAARRTITSGWLAPSRNEKADRACSSTKGAFIARLGHFPFVET
jgi:hypothetical protein